MIPAKKMNIMTKCVALTAPFVISGCVKDSKPNILFILADDYGWKDTGATGSDFYETPNIDRIASNGVNFTTSYASCQVSSPSRASLMTGLCPAKHGITDWIGALSGEEWRTHGLFDKVLPAEYEHELDYQKYHCLPQLLHDAGYTTFMAGKWHLGTETTPEKAGFDINVGGYHAGSPVGGYFVPYGNPVLKDGPAGEQLSMRLATETGKFIENHVKSKSKKPFFAYLSFYAVHTPVQTTKEKWEYFQQKAQTIDKQDVETFKIDGTMPVNQVQDNPVYAGLVSDMDDAVGVVLDKIKELKLDKNTIVIFTSDNGGKITSVDYSTANMPLRGGKGSQWEGGFRVPLFISIPGNSFNGTKCDTPVWTMDLYSTLLDYAGVKQDWETDGVSLRPLLNDGTIAPRTFYWHFPHYSIQGGQPSSIIRDGEWKLIYYHEDAHYELYNLERDPGEQHDVIGENREIADSLTIKLESWLAETGAKMPVPDPEYDAAVQVKYLEESLSSTQAEQKAIHDARLNADWQPDATWWGSMVDD